MRRIPAIAVAVTAALALLSACAPAAPFDIRGQLRRPVIDRSPQPLLLAEMPSRNLLATLVPRDVDGDVVTWQSAQNQTLSLHDGVLVATRGLGDDLMSADVGRTLNALRSGGSAQAYPRLLTYLDGDGQTVFRSLLCDMDGGRPDTVDSFDVAFATTLHVESCQTIGARIENRYWLNADGTMRRTQQWVGPATGPLAIEWLSR
ncbi:Group 4 capsule polysaccharide lipoprotein gfcB, YjbF [Loktanella fryxellensis]|uniref:Group 4 capsule polysaccharide lipoprotein gfcB, YjbF n=1 Tax=Loktanella fryxellensis TaxID=245187 RepID=A0A1H8H4C3_9RHOB|nr:YjbF family lipoprotein [Loktanella fryxellensis]SEN51202.1 Group 4 capsule polysaccharide lipoprotein gfcB, YjbF [Loktanella fryxellensis]